MALADGLLASASSATHIERASAIKSTINWPGKSIFFVPEKVFFVRLPHWDGGRLFRARDEVTFQCFVAEPVTKS